MIDLEILKSYINVEDVLVYYDLEGNYSSSQFIGLCPFHDDRHHSFSVNLDNGLWNCFTCGENGNVFTFVQLIENYEKFGFAVKKIKEIIGFKDENNSSLDYTKQIIDLFNKPKQKRMKAERKVGKVELPPEAVSASKFLELAKKRVTLRMIKVYNIKYADSGFYEGCLIIPIYFHKKLVAFFARDLLNKREKSKVYSKNAPINEIFFNWDLCKKNDYVILVEGMLDCLKVCSWGYNCLALLGVQLSLKKRLMLIDNFTTVYIALDNDNKEKIINGYKVTKNPGQEAASKLCGVLKQDIVTKNIVLPVGKDPDECSKEEFQKCFNEAK